MLLLYLMPFATVAGGFFIASVRKGHSIMSDTTGIPTFFQGLAQHLVDQVNGPIHSSFTIGDDVYYQGSKVADHGYWKVTGTGRGTVTIGLPGTSRSLVVNAASLRHGTPTPAPTPAAAGRKVLAEGVEQPEQDRLLELGRIQRSVWADDIPTAVEQEAYDLAVGRAMALYRRHMLAAEAALEESLEGDHEAQVRLTARAQVHAALAAAAATRLATMRPVR